MSYILNTASVFSSSFVDKLVLRQFPTYTSQDNHNNNSNDTFFNCQWQFGASGNIIRFVFQHRTGQALRAIGQSLAYNSSWTDVNNCITSTAE